MKAAEITRHILVDGGGISGNYIVTIGIIWESSSICCALPLCDHRGDCQWFR